MSQFQHRIIRPLIPADRARWAELWTQYLDFYETSVPDEVMDVTFARLIGDDPQDFNCLVAEEDGRIAGLAHYLFHRHAWKIENVCYLQDLFVSPVARGNGTGRALIEAVHAGCHRGGGSKRLLDDPAFQRNRPPAL